VRAGRSPGRAQDFDLYSVSGREGDVAQDDRIRAVAHRPQLDGWHGDAQDLGHLGLGEGGADAASDPTAEWQPRVRLGAAIDEALGPKLAGLWVEVLHAARSWRCARCTTGAARADTPRPTRATGYSCRLGGGVASGSSTPREAALLAAALDGYERTAFGLACYAGLRAGELLALDWSSIDLDLRVLRVERAWDHGERLFVSPKSRAAERVVPITERLHLILAGQREEHGDGGRCCPTCGSAQGRTRP
jgi:hypothetical protein